MGSTGSTTTDPAARVPVAGDRARVTTTSRVGTLLRLSRPRQWTKNVLVLAAPIAAGSIADSSVLSAALLATAAFTLMASGVYWINDAMDAATDRLHPTKRRRPVASGDVAPMTALYGGLALQVTAIGLAVATVGPGLAGVLAVYAALQIAYSLQLKRVPVAELMVVASGFVIRALAGGVATGLPLSEWFLIVTSFGALFVVTGKRYAESIAMGDLAGEHRAVLDSYPPAFLQQVVGVSLAVTLLAYCLWAFRTSMLVSGTSPHLWVALSVVPVTLVSLRYLLLVAAGRSGEPEELVLRDRVTAVGVLASVAMVVVGLYA